ncbi:hypothetical protein [Pseudomonas atagonensis]|uniref:hypothetical protein n=1 Tax=Pseudomonas atagonensis TaxID=2609964 RepID=UPI00140D4DD2|nr:hypothetical protein [Pseudomonas atagonensis]
MNIFLSPFSSPDQLEIVKRGDVLTINGEIFDFTPMREGDTLPAAAIQSQWVTRDVEFVDGHLVVTLRFPNPPNASLEQRFPEPLLNVLDGPVAFPPPIPMAEFLAANEVPTDE